MKKLLISLIGVLLITVFAGDVPNIQTKEVSAQPNKTKCFVTDFGGFHCEGNPGYEEALKKLNGN